MIDMSSYSAGIDKEVARLVANMQHCARTAQEGALAAEMRPKWSESGETR